MRNNILQPLVFSLILIFGILFGKILSQFDDNEANFTNNKLDSIIRYIQENYVDDFSIEQYEEQILNLIIKELDPFSNYLSAEEQAYEDEIMRGSFCGIGVEFLITDDSLVVRSPIVGGPSHKLGIAAGDRIVEVDGENIASVGIDNEFVFSKLKGPEGTSVQLKVFRKNSSDLLDFEVIRERIPIYSVPASFMLTEGDIGYIKVNRFSATTNQEFSTASNSLLSSGMNRLILDLRGNGGGYLASAIYMCNEFLNGEKLIVYTEGKNRNKDEYYSDNTGNLKGIKLIVLIDEESASASEIVAGCMQDHDRAIIIGRKSFGKGMVQEEKRLPDGSTLRLTTQRYHTPSGRCIQKSESIDEEIVEDSTKYFTSKGKVVYASGGITPDYSIENDTFYSYQNISKFLSENLINEFAYDDFINAHIDHKEYFESLEGQEYIFSLFRKYISEKNNILYEEGYFFSNKNERKLLIELLTSECIKYFYPDSKSAENATYKLRIGLVNGVSNDKFVEKSLQVFSQ